MTAWLVLVTAVVVASLLPAAAPPGAWGLDKIVHFAVFLVLAVAPAAVLPRGWELLCAGVFLVVVGLGIEVAQSFVPGRVGSGDDFFADAVGVFAGVVLGRLVWRRLRAAMWIENADHGPRGPGT
jgi:VanZ family protein